MVRVGYVDSVDFCFWLCCFFFNDTATTEIYTLSLHDALPIWASRSGRSWSGTRRSASSSSTTTCSRSEERFSRNAETDIVCRLLLGKKNKSVLSDREHRSSAIARRRAASAPRQR